MTNYSSSERAEIAIQFRKDENKFRLLGSFLGW